ncbi:MerR family transcriptional regulator [Miniphocaeibacter massiliensis]|uniref:MerR family transcriptional regulator n=1 Tax=Miniphocaeibacter massiliensis TaxID=2041841 RepID=UPI000C1C30C3|nr:MerR family transcriptional regulator [Miniphocaeibacter massiliensis]
MIVIVEENLLNIGELANLFNINEQTLRYYNKVGLLVPFKKGENGYRKYKIEQIYTLATIRYLRNLDYSIDDIKNYLDMMEYESRISNLTEQYKLLTEKIFRLQNIQKAIQRKTSFVEEKLKGINLEDITVVENERRSYMLLGKEKSIYVNNLFYRYITMVEYRKDKKTFLMYMKDFDEFYHENPGILNKDLVNFVEKGKFLTGYHIGDYEGITLTAERIRKEGEKRNILLEDYFITTNIIDQFIESNRDKYITEIQIPLANN